MNARSLRRGTRTVTKGHDCGMCIPIYFVRTGSPSIGCGAFAITRPTDQRCGGDGDDERRHQQRINEQPYSLPNRLEREEDIGHECPGCEDRKHIVPSRPPVPLLIDRQVGIETTTPDPSQTMAPQEQAGQPEVEIPAGRMMDAESCSPTPSAMPTEAAWCE